MRSESELREARENYLRLSGTTKNKVKADYCRDKAELLAWVLGEPKEEPPLTSQELRTLRDIIKNVGRNSNGSFAWLNEGY